MPDKDYQKRAKNKYRREKVRQINLNFYPTDSDLIEYLGTKENKQGFIKDLIREAMESEQK